MQRKHIFIFLLGLVMVQAAFADGRLFTAEELALPGKRGACRTLRDPAKSQVGTWDDNLPKLAKLQPYWNYSWGADWVPQQTNYINSEFVPMIWGISKGPTEALDEKAARLRKAFAGKIIRVQ